MFSTVPNHNGHRRRFGLTEVLLVVGIIGLGGFTLVNEGHQTFGQLLSSVGRVIGG